MLGLVAYQHPKDFGLVGELTTQAMRVQKYQSTAAILSTVFLILLTFKSAILYLTHLVIVNQAQVLTAKTR